MPQPRFRSRTYRRLKTRLPGGDTVTHYEKRKPQVQKCSNCKKELVGIPREMPYKVKSLGITKKRPTRPFGGNLCSVCLRALVKKEARQQ